MKNYTIFDMVFMLISILSGCGGKNYLGEKSSGFYNKSKVNRRQ